MKTFKISSIPLFAGLPVDEIDHLESVSIESAYPQGQVFIHEGQQGDTIYILLEGRVEIIKSLGLPGERRLGERGSGDLLGEMSLFCREGSHTASVRSLTPVQLVTVPLVVWDSLLMRQSQFAYGLMRVLCQRLDESENLAILDLQERHEQLLAAYDELRVAHDQLLELERIDKELEIAGQIQKELFPESLPVVPGYDFGALLVPARSVGGDFFSGFRLGEGRIGFIVGDVCDKGVPSALIMALAYGAVYIEAQRTRSPREVLRKVNRHLLHMSRSHMFVTLIYGILDTRNGIFQYARAGHPSPILMDPSGQFLPVPVTPGQPLGLYDNIPIDEQSILLPVGGMLLLFSDGVSETRNIHDEEFAQDTLGRTISANRKQPADVICDQIWQENQDFCQGLPHQDDFTLLVIKRHG